MVSWSGGDIRGVGGRGRRWRGGVGWWWLVTWYGSDMGPRSPDQRVVEGWVSGVIGEEGRGCLLSGHAS